MTSDLGSGVGRQHKDTRPTTTPIPVRFTEVTLAEIELVAQELAMSRQDVIRLAASAGLKALRRLGYDGLIERLSEEI